jgi:hypothetical protein
VQCAHGSVAQFSPKFGRGVPIFGEIFYSGPRCSHAPHHARRHRHRSRVYM